MDAICAIFQHLQENQPDKEGVMKRFWTKCGFPVSAGATGGTHIEVPSPKSQEKNYPNGCQYFSVIPQAMAGPDLHFIQMFVSFPGFSHNPHELEASRLGHRGDTSTLSPASKKTHNRGPVLIGEGAYPLHQWLTAPVHQPITAEELQFNQRLSTVEAALSRPSGS